jgi:hypothetical protein
MKTLTLVRIGFTTLMICTSHFAAAQGNGQYAPRNASPEEFNKLLDDVDSRNLNGARKEFVASFSSAQEALKADKVKSAKPFIDKLHKTPHPNDYEQARIYLMDYWYEGKLGNRENENEAAKNLLAMGSGKVDPDAFVEAGIRLLKRQYNTKNFGGALITLAQLREESASIVELNSIAGAVKQLDDLSTSTQDLKQEIKTDELGKWSVNLLRTTFFIDKINGEVASIDFACENKQTNLKYVADSVMSTPEAWGKCLLKVNAKPNTTFTFVQSAHKPEAK